MQTGAQQQAIGNLTLNDSIMTATEFGGIVAFAGGGQTSATLLVDGCNEINTVATTADSVKLPPAVGGTVVYLVNKGANSCQVFGSGIDTINEVATGTGVALAASAKGVYFCTRSANAAAATAGEWYLILSA